MMMSLIAALLAAAQPAPWAPPAPLPGWMAGCWMAEGEGNQTEECWTVPRGTMMLGSSHTFSGPTTRWFEHMRIVQDGTTLAFIAQPGGSPPTRFAMVDRLAINDDRPVIIFENLANAYPQRIRYTTDADGSLIAEIAQADGSRVQRWTFRRLR